MNSERSNIVVAMHAIRHRQATKLAMLEEESQRLTDWREYVRSAPLASLAGSVILGALTGSYLGTKSRDSSSAEDLPDKQSDHQFRRSGFIGNAVGFVMPIVTSVARQHLAVAISAAIESINRPRSDEHDTAA